MKKSYLFAPAPTVTASKEIARALIKRDLAFNLPPYENLLAYTEQFAGYYTDTITLIFWGSGMDFYTDLERWIKNEIIKIYRHERKNRHET